MDRCTRPTGLCYARHVGTKRTEIVGIDWATRKKQRALVRLRLSSRTEKLKFVNLASAPSDPDVLECCKAAGVSVVAVDIPFGWPKAFSEFVHGHAPKDRRIRVPDPELFRYRRTELVVRKATKVTPMAVSAEKFAMGAREWASLVNREKLQPQIAVGSDAPQKQPSIIEVYPAATLAALSIAPRWGYKPTKHGDVRESILETLIARFLVPFDSLKAKRMKGGLVAAVRSSDDVLDALVAAITAGIYAQEFFRDARIHKPGIRTPDSKQEKKHAKKEGWIFFPAAKAKHT